MDFYETLPNQQFHRTLSNINARNTQSRKSASARATVPSRSLLPVAAIKVKNTFDGIMPKCVEILPISANFFLNFCAGNPMSMPRNERNISRKGLMLFNWTWVVSLLLLRNAWLREHYATCKISVEKVKNFELIEDGWRRRKNVRTVNEKSLKRWKYFNWHRKRALVTWCVGVGRGVAAQKKTVTHIHLSVV